MQNEKQKFETLAIHAGEESDQHQALNAPIYMTSTFTFNDLQQAEDTFSFNRRAYVYTRGGNPTVNLFERRIAALENGVDSVAFASGMAAISTVLMSFTKQGDNIVAHRNLYGSTFNTTAHVLPKYGVTTKHVDMTDIDQVAKAIDENTKVLYLETPTNPSLEIIDIESIVALAQQHGVKTVIDNTFATPYLQNPLNLGVDVVVHSTTKYISGHGDVVGGVAISKNQEYIYDLKFNYMCEFGGVMSPFNAWLFLRGLKTLSLRMDKHVQNAKDVVEYLQHQKSVTQILYPGLVDHPNHEIAKKQMRDFGGIVSFELSGDLERARRFVENMKMAKLAVSLGDAETLVEIPSLMTHRSYPEEKLQEFGFSNKTIRISTGLENSVDIIEDIANAIDA